MKSNEAGLVYVHCNNCGKNGFKILFQGTLNDDDFDLQKSVMQFTGTSNEYDKHARIVKCNYCGLIYENPRDNTEYVLQNYKEVVDHDYLVTKEERQR